jgi:hypothetical protein
MNSCRDLALTEYVIEILIEGIKDAMIDSPLRTEMIYSILQNKSGVFIYDIFKPERDVSESDEEYQLAQHFSKAIKLGEDKGSRYVATTIMNPPSGNSQETHFIGCIIDISAKKMYHFNTGAGLYGDRKHIIIDRIQKSKVLHPYRFVQEDNGSSSCQLDVVDTYCQTWSAYYIIKRIEDPHFGLKLQQHALKSFDNEKLEKLFDVFHLFTRKIPVSFAVEIANTYSGIAKQEAISKGTMLPELTVEQIQSLLYTYFGDNANKAKFIELIKLYPEPTSDDEEGDKTCVRRVMPGSETAFYDLIGLKTKRLKKSHNGSKIPSRKRTRMSGVYSKPSVKHTRSKLRKMTLRNHRSK